MQNLRKKNLKYRQTLINILAKQKGLTQLNKKVGKIFVWNFAFGHGQNQHHVT